MSAYPTEYLGLITKTQLARMLSETYALARNIELDEAYQRLETSLRQLKLIEGLQSGIWRGMHNIKPESDSHKLVERAAKRLQRRKNFKAIRIRNQQEGAWAAMTVLIDMHAGFSTGEAIGLLDTAEGEALLQKGFEFIGHEIAKTLVS
jgi:hypothetical protein